MIWGWAFNGVNPPWRVTSPLATQIQSSIQICETDWVMLALGRNLKIILGSLAHVTQAHGEPKWDRNLR